MGRQLRAVWLGRHRYAAVHTLQQELHAARTAGEIGDTVLLLEHEPVITLGRGAHPRHVLASETALHAVGIDLASIGRGGDVTLHAPGQLVAYPIIDLSPDRRDVRRYVRGLTEVMRRIAADVGVAAGPAEGMVGLWVDTHHPERWDGPHAAEALAKVGALGVRISRWVTMHGFALNVANDLDLYRYIVPCGIKEHPVTSLAQLLGTNPSLLRCADRARLHLAGVLDAQPGPLEDWSQTLPTTADLSASPPCGAGASP